MRTLGCWCYDDAEHRVGGRVRNITTTQLPQIGFRGIGLGDDDQQVHITIYDLVTEVPDCPTNYLWSNTGEARIRVVQKIDMASRGEEDFLTSPQAQYHRFTRGEALY